MECARKPTSLGLISYLVLRALAAHLRHNMHWKVESFFRGHRKSKCESWGAKVNGRHVVGNSHSGSQDDRPERILLPSFNTLLYLASPFYIFNEIIFSGWKKAFNWAREYALQTAKNKTEAATESQQ